MRNEKRRMKNGERKVKNALSGLSITLPLERRKEEFQMKNKQFNVGALAILLTLAFVLAGCPDPGGGPGGGPGDTFIAVTNITGIPSNKQTDTPLTLNGTVEPSTATNKTIVWAIAGDDDGSTGPSLEGNVLTTTAEGTVKLTATIANGLTATTPYTQNFTIEVSDTYVPPPPPGGNRYVKFTITELTVGGDLEEAYIAVYADAAATQFIGGGKINGDSKTWTGLLADTPANNTVYVVVIACGTDTFYAAKQFTSDLGVKVGTESLADPAEAGIAFGAVTVERQILLSYSFLIDGKVPLQQGTATHSNFWLFFSPPGLVDNNFEPYRFPLYTSETSAETKMINIPDIPSLPFPIYYWAFGWQSPTNDFTSAMYSAEKTSITSLTFADEDWYLEIGEIRRTISGSVNLGAFGITLDGDDVVTIAILREDGGLIASGGIENSGFTTVTATADQNITAYAQIVVYDNMSNFYEPKKVVYSNTFTIPKGDNPTDAQNVGALSLNAGRTHPTITFKVNGGVWEGGGNADIVKLKDSDFKINAELLPAEPSRAGHGFIGWNTQADGNGTTLNVNEPIHSNTVLYAKWEFYPVYVTFKVNQGMWRDGTAEDDERETVSPGVVNPMPADPVRHQFEFMGWNSKADGSGTPVDANTVLDVNFEDFGGFIVLHAKWEPNTSVVVATVTFNANGGSWSGETTKIQYVVASDNEKATPPENPTTPKPFVSASVQVPSGQWLSANLSEGLYLGAASNCIFNSWNTQADGNGSPFTASTAITGDITVYAKWVEPANPQWVETKLDLSATTGNNIVRKASAHMYNNPGDYILMIGSDVNFSDLPVGSTVGLSNASSVIVVGAGARRTITRSNNGGLLGKSGAGKLTLDYNITLQGRSGNNTAVVYVSSGQLVMNEGAIITGNTNTADIDNSAAGGGVAIEAGASFIMNGGTISGNTGSLGGGVKNNGTFIMNGGTISGNRATSTYQYSDIGGGVHNNGTFRIVNGTIYGNTEADTSLRNTSAKSTGAALSADSGTAGQTAQRGTFSIPGDITSTWTSKGTLSTTNATIRVVNGDNAP
jgi:uncharacterized repeat protein (TIGR02543 family)